MIGAYLICGGHDTCLVGLLPVCYLEHATLLQGRLCQVTHFFDDSRDAHLRDYSASKQGVCTAVIFDKYVKGDEELNELLYDIDSGLEED